MADYVVARLAAENQPVEWVSVDSSGARQSGTSSGELAQLAAEIGDRLLIALVPATDCLITTANIPARSSSKIRTALPYALEEDLADDIDELHFAFGLRQENGRLPVVVVAQEKMKVWVNRLRSEGLEPVRMLAENHGLAKIPGTLSLLVDGNAILFNDGADNEFVMQDVKPSDVLVLAGELGEQQQEEASGHLLVFCSSEAEQRLTHDWIALRHEMHSVDVKILPDGVLAKLAMTVATGQGVNLLQSTFGKKTDYGSLLRPWKIAAAFLLIFFISAFVLKGVSYSQLLNEKTALQEKFTAAYREIRPADTRVITDPVAIVRSLQRSLGDAAAPQVFLPSLRELAAALAENSAVEVDAITYRAGIIDLQVTAPNVATLDNIQKSVSASGRFQASIQRTDQVADKINGRIQIREIGE